MDTEKNQRKIGSVLVTGASGSGGSYLAEFIAQNYSSIRLHGLCRWHSTSTNSNLSHISNSIEIHECDLKDMASVIRVLERTVPEAIFHLASHANVQTSFDTPLSVLENNIIGTANLLEAIRILKINPIIQICSTSEVYGQVDAKYVPIDEKVPLCPASPYAVSKTSQDLLGGVYYEGYGLRIIRTRMFAYINPRRSDLFASSFARQVARVESGLQEEVLHGNLDSVRTLVDVRDAVRAYWEAARHCAFGEVYNIGGTKTITVGEFLHQLILMSGKHIPTRLDERLLRPIDVTLQIPNVDKFVSATGWSPKYSFEESLQYLLEYWREETRRSLLAI